MDASVVGAVIGVTLKVVLQQLLSLPLDQIKDFKKDLAKLKTSFDYVHDVLHDANMQNVTDRAVIRWMRNLEALAFEADNVLDEISYQLLSKEVKKITLSRAKNKVLSLFSHSKNLGSRIREINEKLELIKKDATDFGLQARLAVARAPDFGSHASASMETDSFTVDPIFIGRENDVLRIVDKLVTASPAERVLSVLPIVGMGGLGKSTLARKVFSDQRIISHFDGKRVWVHVHRKFNKAVILKNILTSLTIDNVEHGNIEVLLKKLQYNLGPNKYLLVLDDVWNEEREKWDGFVNSLLGISSAVGNCVVVTTRSHEVASIVSTLGVHKLEGLPKDDCWSIIKAKTFNAGDDLVDEYETMGRNIAERCQGLPLAAKVVGGLLCNKSRDEWNSFETNFISNFGDVNSISKILKLSFDNLSVPSLKKCFAYCSIFPKGYGIPKGKLVDLWMGEGFLETGHNKNNIKSTGSTFFEILLQQSLLQVAQRDRIHGYATHWNMHDLVHDLSRSILVGENNNVMDKTIQMRYIGCNFGGDIESLSIPKEEARYVRTLFFDGKVSDIGFSNFKSLRTLTLLGREIDTLPISIKELIHLRYLDTSETRIRYFPESLGELYHLETLRAQINKLRRSYLEKLPNSLKYLISLRHLQIPKNVAWPPHIGRLASLQTLSHFHVKKENGYKISELGRLENLKGNLVIHNLENVRDKNDAMGAYLFQKENISKLALKWNEGGRELAEVNDESVLEGLEPHPNLKRLTIGGFNARRFPSWTLKMEVRDDRGLNNLSKIKLKNCMLVEEVPMLGHLPHLKALTLSTLENVTCIGSSFYGINNCNSNEAGTIYVFRALEMLTLSDMTNLREWEEVEFPPSEGHDHQTQPCQLVVFPRLEHLSVSRCRQLMSAPSNFKCLTHLHMYEMDSGLPLENIFGGKLTTLQSLTIKRIEGVERLPDWLFFNNHNLSRMLISGCLNLRELPDGLHTLKYLEALVIEECPNLKSRAAYESQTGGFTSLCELGISHCKGLSNLSIEILKSCSVSLKSLSLNAVFSPMNVQIFMECLLKMPRLHTLRLSPSALNDSCSWDDNVSFNEFVNAIFQTSKLSLNQLSLSGMSHWKHLPNQIHHHLTSLPSLVLIGFGMESLPEWFGNTTSLISLHLSNCKMLRYLPSKRAMQCLTKLTMLSIANCPLLLKERSNEDEVPQIVDSEWTKISHIRHIRVDHHPIT